MLKINDVCKIVRQPDNQIIQLLGGVGFIEETSGEVASFYKLRLDGTLDGCGAVPLDCLELVTDPSWIEAKRVYDNNLEMQCVAARARTDRYRKHLAAVAEKHSITPEAAEAIYNAVGEFYR